MRHKVGFLLAGALLAILVQGCQNTSEPDSPDLETQLVGKWMLTQTSVKGEYQFLIPCYQFDSIMNMDTSFTAFEGDYYEFKAGNSYQFKVTTVLDFLSYCSEFAGKETSRPYSLSKSRALGKKSAISSGQWWINGTQLFLTAAYEIGKALDTNAHSFKISGNQLTIKGPFRLDKEYREQGFSIFGTLEIVQSARKL